MLFTTLITLQPKRQCYSAYSCDGDVRSATSSQDSQKKAREHGLLSCEVPVLVKAKRGQKLLHKMEWMSGHAPERISKVGTTCSMG